MGLSWTEDVYGSGCREYPSEVNGLELINVDSLISIKLRPIEIATYTDGLIEVKELIFEKEGKFGKVMLSMGKKELDISARKYDVANFLQIERYQYDSLEIARKRKPMLNPEFKLVGVLPMS